jgi:hypothetical protein
VCLPSRRWQIQYFSSIIVALILYSCRPYVLQADFFLKMYSSIWLSQNFLGCNYCTQWLNCVSYFWNYFHSIESILIFDLLPGHIKHQQYRVRRGLYSGVIGEPTFMSNASCLVPAASLVASPLWYYIQCSKHLLVFNFFNQVKLMWYLHSLSEIEQCGYFFFFFLNFSMAYFYY